VYHGPGILSGWKIVSDLQGAVSTADITIKDSNIVGAGSTIMTKTNYGYAAPAIRPTVTTSSFDEGGSVVTTAATGSYVQSGLLFATGLNVNVAQANAVDAAYSFDFLIDG
jgi:hypothetical protein